MIKYIVLFLFSVYVYTLINEKINDKVVNIYKNPIFKVVFLLTLYAYGHYDPIISLVLATFYVMLDFNIKKQDLLFKII
jgi:hypothetical protein